MGQKTLAFFYGEFELPLDSKFRITIPAEVRNEMIDKEKDGEAFFLITGKNRKLWLYPEKPYREMASQQSATITPSDEILALNRLKFAMAKKLSWDTQGRAPLSEKTKIAANLGDIVVLIGMVDHMEIWQPDQWEVEKEKLRENLGEIESKAAPITRISAA